MAYKALYRTYRPLEFEEMVGQKHIVTTLKNAIKNDKIAHAYLFCGPRGTGKTTSAKILAKAINCENKEEAPCNRCDNCISVNESNHPDIVEIDAASNNGVDEIRNLIEKVKYAPLKGKYKIYIIDEVHMLSQGAFNALLKTLEEPPEHIVFMLATTEPHKILPTIISRCQRFDFTKVSNKDLEQRIETIAQKEDIELETGASELISSLSDGGVRDALSIFDQCIAYAGNKVSKQDVYDIYGIATKEEKINLIKLILDNEVNLTLATTEEIVNKSIEIKRFIIDLIQIFKEIYIYGSTQDKELLKTLEENEAKELLEKLKRRSIFKYIDILLETVDKLKTSLNAKMLLEITILKLTDIKEENIRQNIVIEENTSKKEVVNKIDIKEMINKPEIDFDEYLNILVQANLDLRKQLMAKWDSLSKYLVNQNMAKVATLLKDSVVVAVCKEAIIVRSGFEVTANKINDEINQPMITKILEDFVGHAIKCYGISDSNWKLLTNKYLQLKNSNQLPLPKKIVVQTIEEEIAQNNEDPIVTKINQTFGEGLFEIVEE